MIKVEYFLKTVVVLIFGILRSVGRSGTNYAIHLAMTMNLEAPTRPPTMPEAITPNERFFVPDLSPQFRADLLNLKPKFIFVAESPHINEIEPASMLDRRPLCGTAGRQWWSALSEFADQEPNQDVRLTRQLQVCKKLKIAVMNAVQFPLDPKIAQYFEEADPVRNLGFSKVAGIQSFKKLKATPPVIQAIQSLRKRLNHPSLQDAKIFPLGNDAEWFILQALTLEQTTSRAGQRIPHPSAWWRQGGLFGRIARERLGQIFSPNSTQ